MYLELDGTYLRYHQGAERKAPILVATGYRADGTRDLLHIGVGNRESYENWKGFLQEMVARGMREPLLIVTDGNPGVLKAIAEVFPRSLKQRCQKHRLENILCKAPKEVRDELKAAILESFHANSYEQGLKKCREVIARYRQRFPSAMKCKEETLEACLQALRLPAAHHKRLRTSNLLERTFGEHKRRTKVIPHFFTEEAAMKLSFAVLLAVAKKWRGVPLTSMILSAFSSSTLPILLILPSFNAISALNDGLPEPSMIRPFFRTRSCVPDVACSPDSVLVQATPAYAAAAV